jgi:hypothetical protein
MGGEHGSAQTLYGTFDDSLAMEVRGFVSNTYFP